MTRHTGKRHSANVDRLARKLDRMRAEADMQAFGAVAATAAELHETATDTLRRAPGSLSRLATEINVRSEGTAHRVTATHPAAQYVEFGTRHMPPYPFLQPAADVVRPSLRKRMGGAVRDLLRRRR